MIQIDDEFWISPCDVSSKISQIPFQYPMITTIIFETNKNIISIYEWII